MDEKKRIFDIISLSGHFYDIEILFDKEAGAAYTLFSSLFYFDIFLQLMLLLLGLVVEECRFLYTIDPKCEKMDAFWKRKVHSGKSVALLQ